MPPPSQSDGASNMTIWSEIQNNLSSDLTLLPGMAVLTALSTAIKCSRNIKFKEGCDCGERFSGRVGDQMEDCYRVRHSTEAVGFIQASVEEQGWSMWDDDDQMLIDLQVLWTELTEGNVLDLLEEGITGIWAAAVTVINRANNTPRSQSIQAAKRPGDPTAQSSGDNTSTSSSARWSCNSPPQPGSSGDRSDQINPDTEDNDNEVNDTVLREVRYILTGIRD